MNPLETTVSIIIPSHNRSHSLKRLLDKIGLQTYPLHLIEVIAVANSCTDHTVKMLQHYKAPFRLRYAETSGEGPAVPRNKGASLATGDLLIFLDDDIDPSEGLTEAHVLAHKEANCVVVGYLPLPLPVKAGFFKINLREWWEKKFDDMRKPGYRYSYEDLLSGNFSLPSELFQKIQGFITTLKCRDDYELGIRLVQAGAQLKFSQDAWGFHCDEVTDLNRSLKRKREEGRTDVHLWRLHPEITNTLQDDYKKKNHSFLQSKTALVLLKWPRLTDRVAQALRPVMDLLELMKIRGKWQQLSYKLHTYWYYRGLLDQLATRKGLEDYFHYAPKMERPLKEVKLDLREGMESAEALLDQVRPDTVQIRYGHHIIGTIPFKAGVEPLKGIHLRPLLATQFSKPLTEALAIEKLSDRPAEVA